MILRAQHALNSSFIRLTVARLTTTEEDIRQSCVTIAPTTLKWSLVRFNGWCYGKDTQLTQPNTEII